MAELPFDPEEIEELALRLNAVVAREGEDIPDPGGNASDDEIPEMLQEHEDDPDRIELADEIDGMDVEQQEALVALFWIGRGDAEPEDWEETLELARERHTGAVSDYLLSKPMAGDHLTEGLERLREAVGLE